MKKITVRVPATTANIGPGFDSMGCALALYNTITCEMLPENKLIVTGCPQQYRNDENLAVQGYRAVLGRLGLPRKVLRWISGPISRSAGAWAAAPPSSPEGPQLQIFCMALPSPPLSSSKSPMPSRATQITLPPPFTAG